MAFIHVYEADGNKFFTISESAQRPTGEMIRLMPKSWLGKGTGAGAQTALKILPGLKTVKEETEVKAPMASLSNHLRAVSKQIQEM
jgi:hypothetical protein